VEGCQSFNAPRFCGARVPLKEVLNIGDHPTNPFSPTNELGRWEAPSKRAELGCT